MVALVNFIAGINPQREYTPMQLWKLGVFSSMSGSTKSKAAYQLLIRLIHAGKIPARNDSVGKIPRWRVKGQDFIDYLASRG